MALFDPARAAAINQSVLSNNTTTTTTKSTSAIDPSAEPHEAYVSSTRYCNIPGGHTSGWRVKQGIEYLGTVAGTPTEGPGPGACGRVSCSYGAAIYWCNDVSFDLLASLISTHTLFWTCMIKRQDMNQKLTSSSSTVES